MDFLNDPLLKLYLSSILIYEILNMRNINTINTDSANYLHRLLKHVASYILINNF